MAKIKICGLMRAEDIEAVNKYRPDYVGFVLAPSKRRVSAQDVRRMSAKLEPSIQRVGVFVDEDREMLAKIAENGIIDIIQLHGHEPEEDIVWLKARTKAAVIKAVSVRTGEDIEAYRHSVADYLLLDNGAGGTGSTFDWSTLENIKRPFFLAGGLNASNIEEALKYNPYCVDVSSGVETAGRKDAAKIQEIIDIVRRK